MAFVSTWEKLSEARSHVMANTGCSREEAEADICRAIADGAVLVRAKLGSRKYGGISADTVLDGKAFRIPTSLKPEDLDWQESRPLIPWLVLRGADASHGHWELEWIELFTTDVTNALCGAPKESKPAAQDAPSDASPKSRSRPALERAQRVIHELYPLGLPGQAALPNSLLCRRVGATLRELRQPGVSDDTILRAAGRRRN
jgi:hypothetical protein